MGKDHWMLLVQRPSICLVAGGVFGFSVHNTVSLMNVVEGL